MSVLQVAAGALAAVLLVYGGAWVWLRIAVAVCRWHDRRAPPLYDAAQVARAWLKPGPTESYERERAARLRAAKTQRKTS